MFVLRSSKTKHFKMRIALMNGDGEMVLEWTSNAPVYFGSIPDPTMLEPAKNDGVFTFEISLLPITAEPQQQQTHPPLAAVKVPPPPGTPPKQPMPPTMQPKQGAGPAAQPKGPPGPASHQQNGLPRQLVRTWKLRPVHVPPTQASLTAHRPVEDASHVAKRPRTVPPVPSNVHPPQGFS